MYILFGHRGNKKYTENTFESFYNCSLEGIETDIQLTYDDEVILHHDSTFERIYNSSLSIKNMYLNDIKNKFPTVVEFSEFISFTRLSNKKIIIDIKENNYYDIIFLLEKCIYQLNKIKYNLKNVIFLCWVDIIKPFKNITFLRAISNDKISSKQISILKNDLLFDGICLKYTGTPENINCINKIKSKNMLVNIYSDKNIQDIKLENIKPDFITL